MKAEELDVSRGAWSGPARVTLYVTGAHRSAELIGQLTDEASALGDLVDLSVVDVLDDPGRAEKEAILATPMIVRWEPVPVRRITGDIVSIAHLLPTPEEREQPQAALSMGSRSSDEGAIISRAAHELRTPLVVIRGFAQTLVDSLARLDQETAQRCAEAIVRGSTQLQGVLESMLALSAVERDGIKLSLAEVHLDELAQETVRDLKPLAVNHKLSVDVFESVLVHADASKVRQIITNLLTNAFKFTPADSTVRVVVRGTEDSGCVAVIDEGLGIPQDQLDKIFDQYERLGQSEKGMGLGLYISRRLANAHGGSLTASAADTGGARFELVLPRSVP